jgi:hypothetical protein
MKQAVLLSAASVAMGTMAFAETVSYSDSKPTDFTNWEDTFQIQQFDPALGTLLSVQISMSGTNSTQTFVENKSTLNRTLRSGSDVTLNLSSQLGSLISVIPQVRFTNSLARYDENPDFGGTSGFSNPFRDSVATSARLLIAGVDDVSQFVGLGALSLDLTAVATGFYNGPADYEFEVITRAGAEVVVTYEYQPPQEDPLGELGDRVWHDLNNDGVQDPGEPDRFDADGR